MYTTNAVTTRHRCAEAFLDWRFIPSSWRTLKLKGISCSLTERVMSSARYTCSRYTMHEWIPLQLSTQIRGGRCSGAQLRNESTTTSGGYLTQQLDNYIYYLPVGQTTHGRKQWMCMAQKVTVSFNISGSKIDDRLQRETRTEPETAIHGGKLFPYVRKELIHK